ncbi:L-lactate permease [Actinotignum sanguinis]|uniref:L-lactate permease n=3 Tax=Actinomycetaceae TaxID=2049 RepID=S2VMB2_9ACTO|nr:MULTISPECIES: lactate permease LctP family transporter [Actinotignum]WPJ89101.1 lactate permease LctP family transporter [Schaalia turicensis]EPD28618.1 lactate permease (LctP) family transporter [Actinotignum schaalii FB123-CNA-2]MDE1564704.1 lactate permease LctP family transporter [Actinotignum sanguinis]MDE1576739.1 lactate permease LctP family transporter [Actinotignum sanguinis]MDE1642307.1 lactate permease LctP family transporter [Actinotignum sanguinis]
MPCSPALLAVPSPLSALFPPSTLLTSATFTPAPDAVGGQLWLSALLAALPLLVFFVLLGVFSVATHWCSLISLGLALVIAVTGFGMPAELAGLSALQGAAFGLFPICYIVIMAVWLYNLTESSGRSKDVQAVFAALGRGDMRVQTILIGFIFCGLIEGLAGFGAPVAISCAMLLAIGLPPVKAALATMVGNGINVALGAMGIPLTTVARMGGVADPMDVAAVAGRIIPVVAVGVPLLLVFIVDGKRGVKDTWPVALTAGIGMVAGHVIASNFISHELIAVIASLLSFALTAVLLTRWHPAHTPAEFASAPAREKISASRVFLGLLPYLLVVVVLAVTKLWRVTVPGPTGPRRIEFLAQTDISFGWPGLHGHLVDQAGNALSTTTFTFNWLSSPGTMLFLTGVVVTAVYARCSSGGRYPYSFRTGLATLGATVANLAVTVGTIATIMALAYVMNFSGQTQAIGAFMALAGTAFAALSAFLGWIGTAVTGSATSSAALFGNLQATAAAGAGIDPHLLLAANQLGGGLGKIVSPQNLAIAATAVRAPGSEPELLRRGAAYSLGLLALLTIVVVLAASGVLGFITA